MASERDPLLGVRSRSDSFEAAIRVMEKRSIAEASALSRARTVYASRWYILAVFALAAFTQSCAWNSWGPIADTTKEVLGWTDADIALLTNLGPIMYVISAFFFSWLMDVKGLRVAITTTGALLAFGLAIRCIPISHHHWKWTMNVGHAFIGLAGPVLMAAPPLISAVWFPAHQRTTATAITTIAGYLGVAASFLIGPYMVNHSKNGSTTLAPVTDSTMDWELYSSSQQSDQINDIRNLMYIELSWGAVLLVCMLVYYPAKPPQAPSKTASIQRTEFWKGAKQIRKCGNFWTLGIAYGILCGTYGGWITELDTMLSLINLGQKEAGWLGFYANIGGAIGGLVLSWSVDRLGGKIRIILLLLSSVGMVCFLWFLLICLKLIPLNTASIYISSILGGLAINSSIPLFYEMGVEAAYPLAEGFISIVMTWLNNFFGLTFFLIFFIPNIGVKWMIWFLPCTCLASIPLILLFKENYNRLSVDVAEENQEVSGHKIIKGSLAEHIQDDSSLNGHIADDGSLNGLLPNEGSPHFIHDPEHIIGYTQDEI